MLLPSISRSTGTNGPTQAPQRGDRTTDGKNSSVKNLGDLSPETIEEAIPGVLAHLFFILDAQKSTEFIKTRLRDSTIDLSAPDLSENNFTTSDFKASAFEARDFMIFEHCESEVTEIKTKAYIEKCPNFPDLNNHPLKNLDGMKILFQTAQELIQKYPTGRIISLGQSPAWIIKTASLIDREPLRFDGVAFSGSLFEYKDQLGVKFFIQNLYPGQKKIAAYRNYLKTLSLSPEQICKIHHKSNPLVIVEHAQSGQGIKSFLSILWDWAGELGLIGQMLDALTVHLLMTPKYSLPQGVYLGTINTQTVPHEFMIDLANSDEFDDRLLPHYNYEKWQDEAPFPEFGKNLSKNAEIILSENQNHLQILLP